MSQQLRTMAFLTALAGIATYSGMDVVMKGLSLELGTYNAMLWRSMIAVTLAGALYAWQRPAWPAAPVLTLHVWRGCVIAVMAFLFFWGLKYLPVAEAIGLTFIAPLIALYLAAVTLGETVGRQAIIASVIGLIGAFVVIGGRLAGDYDADVGRGIAAILCSALLYAYNIILQRQQALVAKPVEIAFFQNLTVILLFASLAPWMAVAPPAQQLPNLTAAAVLGLVSMMMMSWAYARAPANSLIPVEYTAFAWAALFGWLVFAESVTLSTVVGTALIVGGCLVASWQRPERAQHVETTAA